jgi:L-lysine 6-transaminase
MSTNPNNVHATLGKHILADGFPLVMDFKKSHGSYIQDARTGIDYLDMFSMYASAAIGYNHPYIKAKSAWLGEMATYKPAMSDMYYTEYADFMEVFSRVAIPQHLQYCFFVEGGGLAVENALKAAFDWKTRKNWLNGDQTEGSICVHFKEAFHGRTGYTMSLTNTSDPRKYQYFPKFDWPRLPSPKRFFPETAEGLAKTIETENEVIAQFKASIAANPGKVACIIIEPIQSEGGDNHFRDEFFVQLRQVCDENDVLLIFDEVQTGIAISGKMWTHEHFSIKPDIVSFGKKTQVCGILANKEKFDQVEKHVFVESSRINSTFGGNFIDMLRFQLVLEVIEQENLLQNAQTAGAFLLEGLKGLEAKHEKITNARGLGLLCAIDLPTTELRNDVVNTLMNDEKIIILSCGDRTIRFRSHLNVTTDELQTVISAIDKVVGKL